METTCFCAMFHLQNRLLKYLKFVDQYLLFQLRHKNILKLKNLKHEIRTDKGRSRQRGRVVKAPSL